MGLETAAAVAAIASTALAATSTGIALSKGGAKMPPIPAKPPAPPTPPPAPPLPPAPTATETEEVVGRDKRKQTQRFGVAQTLLASPLGGASAPAGGGQTLLGG
jgi:hypothetical protein